MYSEREEGRENEEHSLARTTLPLVEIIGRPHDPENLGFAGSMVSLAHIHYPQAEIDEYFMAIIHPLSPQNIKRLITSTTSTSAFYTPSENSKFDWNFSNMKSLYEDVLLFRNRPVPSGHFFVSMDQQRNNLLAIFKHESSLPEDQPQEPEKWIGKNVGKFHDLDLVTEELLELDSYNGLELRNPLFTSLSPGSYINLHYLFNVLPQYENGGKGEMRIKKYPKGSKIITRMAENPKGMQKFLINLPTDELITLAAHYAITTNGGYIENRADGKNVVVLGIGSNQQVAAEVCEPLQFNKGNIILSARLTEIQTELGPGYTATVDTATLKEYALPLLHWKSQKNPPKREWDLSTPTSEQIQTLLDLDTNTTKSKLITPSKLSPLLGLLTAFRYFEPKITNWDDVNAISKKPFSPAHTLATVALNQRTFLKDPLLDTIEQHFSQNTSL